MTTFRQNGQIETNVALAAELRLNRMVEGRDVVTGTKDSFILRFIALEVATDDFARGEYLISKSIADGSLNPSSVARGRADVAQTALKNEIVATALALVVEMEAGDIEMADEKLAVSIIPPKLRTIVADAEVRMLRGNGKGGRNVADRRRNYGFDNFAPISGF